jgi:REP element-mobilizing transposase RayT
MRTARLKVPKDHPTGFYHCLSRIVDRRFIFEATEKEHFLALMRECERFCRVRVLTYALMSNHFHILLAVPQRPLSLPGPEEIIEDLKHLSGHQFPEAVRQRFDLLREHKDDAGLAAYLETFHRRMYDVSAFMKMLKQRFSQWYNVRKGRKGTLWEERFRSVLVDGAGDALVTMAAYIDLNPVRAGVVKDPKDYRWCGYGEAMAGGRQAQTGVQFLVTALQRGREETQGSSLEIYRKHLYLEGDERREATGPDGRPVRGALSAEEVAKVLSDKGRLPLSEYLKCRVRYFCDGAVFGGREYVEGIFKEYRKRFGPKRKTGARRMRGLADASLYTVRNLRLGLFGRLETTPDAVGAGVNPGSLHG